jgi:proton-coupled amino acid transporter
MASTQQQPPSRNYTHLDAAADDAVAAERGTAENGTTEVRNPLAPPTSEPPRSAAEPLQPPIEPEEEPDGSKFRAVVAVVRCMVGPAALYIPKGFADAGLAGGLMCVTVAMALFAFGMARLIASWRHARANDINSPGLDGVAYALAGPWAGHLATFCVTAMQCGVGVTYYIFVAENVDMLAPSRYNLTMGAVILAMAVLEAPLSLFKRLQRLHGLNAAGNLLVALALFTIFAVALERLDREGPAPSNYGIGSPGKVLTFAGTAVFAFEGTASIVVPVCDATARAHRGSLEYVVVGATAAVALAYALFGIACSLAFGRRVDVIVAESLPQTWWPGGLVRLAYVLVVLVTFPLQLFPVSDLVSRGRQGWWSALPRLALVGVLALLAFAFRHRLDHVVSLLGALACAPLALVVGPWAHLSVAATPRARALDRACICVGWVICVAATANALVTWRDAAS